MKEPLDLILGDLRYIREELQRNEAIGETRFGYFVALVSAVSTAIVTLWKTERPAGGASADAWAFTTQVAQWALLALLIFGLLTYVRLRHRNTVTDDLKTMGDRLRNRAVALCPELDPYDDSLRWPKRRGLSKIMRAGYAEVIGIIDGALLYALIRVTFEDCEVFATLAGVSLAVGLWQYAMARGTPKRDTQHFRAGVGAVIRRPDGKVLACKRRGAVDGWQFPQGGLEVSEDLETAAKREITEETGIPASKLALTAAYRGPLLYELPRAYRNAKTGRGQVLYWFLFDAPDDLKIRLPDKGEFVDKDWFEPAEVLEKVVEFRKPVYARLVDWLQGV